MSHVTYRWVMSHINAVYTRTIYRADRWDTEPTSKYETILETIGTIRPCQWVTSNIYIRHVTHMTRHQDHIHSAPKIQNGRAAAEGSKNSAKNARSFWISLTPPRAVGVGHSALRRPQRRRLLPNKTKKDLIFGDWTSLTKSRADV